MPDLIRISLTFFLILALLRKKTALGTVMLAASGVLAFLYRMDPGALVTAAGHAAASHTTITLLLSLSLIRIFELMLREQQVLSGMTASVKRYVTSRRAVIVSMPVLIGTLPSLGGAYFSAPMVKEATEGLAMSSEERAFINYWFRHPWEFILPLYPGLLLAAAVTGISLPSLIGANFIPALLVCATGFALSMRKLGPEISVAARPATAAGWKDGLYFLPVAAILLLVVLAGMELPYALLFMIAALFFFYRYHPGNLMRLFRYGFTLQNLMLIFGTMLFKETMESSGAVANLSRFFLLQGIPVLPVLCLLPFASGLLTGLTIGFVGSTFPLLITLTGGASPAHISLAFVAGFLGVLLSPLHICLLLSREYFSADLWGVYRKILPAAAVIFTAAVGQFLLAR